MDGLSTFGHSVNQPLHWSLDHLHWKCFLVCVFVWIRYAGVWWIPPPVREQHGEGGPHQHWPPRVRCDRRSEGGGGEGLPGSGVVCRHPGVRGPRQRGPDWRSGMEGFRGTAGRPSIRGQRASFELASAHHDDLRPPPYLQQERPLSQADGRPIRCMPTHTLRIYESFHLLFSD